MFSVTVRHIGDSAVINFGSNFFAVELCDLKQIKRRPLAFWAKIKYFLKIIFMNHKLILKITTS